MSVLVIHLLDESYLNTWARITDQSSFKAN